MAAREVIHTEEPKETVVVHEDRRDRGSSAGVIAGIIILILILLFLFGGNIFNMGGNGGTSPTNNTSVEVPAPQIETPSPTPAGE